MTSEREPVALLEAPTGLVSNPGRLAPKIELYSAVRGHTCCVAYEGQKLYNMLS